MFVLSLLLNIKWKKIKMDETDPEIHFKEDQRELDMGQGDVDENYVENANDEHLIRGPDHINNSKFQGDFRQ